MATAALTLGMACIGMVFGSTQIALARITSGGSGEAGLLYALLGAGSAMAGLVQVWLPARIGWRTRYVASGVGLLAGTANVIPIVMAVPAAGFGVSPYLIALFGAVEHTMPRRRYTSGLAIVCAGSAVGSAAGQLIAGHLAREAALNAAALTVGAAILATAVAVIFTTVIWRHSASSHRARQSPGMPL
jgi:MFS family permease